MKQIKQITSTQKQRRREKSDLYSFLSMPEMIHEGISRHVTYRLFAKSFEMHSKFHDFFGMKKKTKHGLKIVMSSSVITSIGIIGMELSQLNDTADD